MDNKGARATLTIAAKPAGKSDFRLAGGFVVAAMAIVAVALAMIDRSATPSTAFMPLGAAGIGLVLLIVAQFFAAHYVLNRDPAMLAGFGGFVATALILGAQALTQVGHPGDMPIALQWMVVARHVVFVIGLLVYARLRRAGSTASLDVPVTRPLIVTFLAATVIAAGVVWGALAAADHLPGLIHGDGRSLFATHVVAPGLLLLYVIAAAIIVMGRRRPSVLDLWIATAGATGVAVYCETAFVIGIDGSARLILQLVQIEVFAMLTGITAIIALEVVALHQRSLALNDELLRLAAVDGLTGLADGDALAVRLRVECDCVDREGTRLALLLLEIDNLAPFNARYGRFAGDHCVQAIAGALRAIVRRPSDLVARRFEGTFAIVLSGASKADAGEVASRIVSAVRDMAMPHAGAALGIVTISVGVAAYRRGDGDCLLVRVAEDALARAMAAGGDRVEGDAQVAPALEGDRPVPSLAAVEP